MTQDFVENGVNVYGGPLDNTPSEPLTGVHFRSYKVPKPSTEIGWEIRIDDIRAGYGQNEDYYGATLSVGNLARSGFAKTSSSTLDSRFRRHLLLPSLATTATVAASQDTSGAYWTTFLSTLVIANGSNSVTPSLFKEASGGGLTTITYIPSGPYTGLSTIVQNGASAAEQLLVMVSGAVPVTLVDLTTGGPTAGTTGHANLSSCWGHVQSPINATTPGTGTNLFYANSGIWSSPITAAISAAPTQVLSNVRNGGWSMGIEQLPENLPLRWFLAIPKANSTTSVAQNTWFSSNPVPVDVYHLNLEGSDPQIVPFSLNRVFWTAMWQRNVVATDAFNVEAFDGNKVRDLHFLRGRPTNSDFTVSCQGFVVRGRDLYAVVFHDDNTASSTTIGNSYYQLELYMSELDAWIPVTKQIVPGKAVNSVAIGGFLPARQGAIWSGWTFPFSKQTGLTYIPSSSSTGTFQHTRVFLPPTDINPFVSYRQTGSTQYKSQEWESTGVWTSPYWQLPDLDGVPKCIDEIVFEGDVDAGGTAASVVVTAGDSVSTMTATFQTGLAHLRQIVSNPDKSTRFYELQVAITLTRDSTTTKTPNGLPIVIRGRAFPEATSTTTLSRDRRGR